MKLGALLKWGILIRGVVLKGWSRKFAVRHFYNGQGKLKVLYKNLMKSPKVFIGLFFTDKNILNVKIVMIHTNIIVVNNDKKVVTKKFVGWKTRVDHIKISLSKFIHSFCKLDHFSTLWKIVNNYETV
jgi:hypothetical protein